MRVAIDASRAVLAQRTGTERYSLELIRALLRLDRGWEYLLYFNQPPSEDLIAPGPNWESRTIPQRRLWTHLRLARELAQDRPDLLFVPAHVLPLVHPRRSVVTVHDLGFRQFPRAHHPLSRIYLELSTHWAARRATRLIAISLCTARDLQRAYRVRSDRIRVVYEGVDPSFAPVADTERLAALRGRYGLGEAPYFLALGTLQPRKNLRRLLRAFRELPETAWTPRLVLAGPAGQGAAAVDAQILRLGLTGRVIRPGYVADEHLPALYSGALAYVQPSLYEGFGLTVLEAMACGTPVAAASTSALPEVLGSAGLFFDPLDVQSIASALRLLATGPDLRARLAEHGRRRAAQFTWERCARETLAVLEEAASC